MNRKQLQKLGVPPRSVKVAVQTLSRAAQAGKGFGLKGKRAKELICSVLESPQTFLQDPVWSDLARDLLTVHVEPAAEPIEYPTWGEDIDEGAHAQMRQACRVPSAVGAALMPDAHIGYGLPIGGVLACKNAVIPYAVGVDIACRMKLSVFDMPVDALDTRRNLLEESILRGTRFGVGVEYKPAQNHAVMDRNWQVTRITREKKDTAWRQLGTSG